MTIDENEYVRQDLARREIHQLVSSTDSNTLKHAARELELLGEEPTTVLGYLQMIKVFSEMGHSGGSASVFIPTINRLLEQRNLLPLTDDPDEWVHHTEEIWPEPGGVWQNVRNGEAFSSDGGKTYHFLSDQYVKDDSKKIYTSHDHTKPFDRDLGTSGQTVQDVVFEEQTADVDVEPVDGKYGRIITERGHFEDNEPLFILRGRDVFTVPVLQHYWDLCAEHGATKEHLADITKHAQQISDWQMEHGTKIPD
jgi:hypothetical protein